MGQRPGLAGARPGQQQQRAGAERDSLRLLGGQPGEQALGPGRRVIAHARVGVLHESPPSVMGWNVEAAGPADASAPFRRRQVNAGLTGSALPRCGRTVSRVLLDSDSIVIVR